MGIFTMIAIYFVIWWTVLFVILPLGVRTQIEEDEIVAGSAPSAPVVPHLGRKVVQTSALAAVVFAVFYVATQVYGMGVDSFPRIIPTFR